MGPGGSPWLGAYLERRVIIQAMKRPLPPLGRARCRDGLLALAVAMLAGSAVAPAPPRAAGAAPAARGAAELLSALGPEKIVDMSYPFDEKTIYWPTARPFQLTHDFTGRTEGGYFYASNSLCAREHGGTHPHAPSPISESGLTPAPIPPPAPLLPAVVI